MGLLISLVLSTLANPTLALSMPLATFISVIAPSATNGASAVPVKSPASWTIPFTKVVASGTEISAASIHSVS